MIESPAIFSDIFAIGLEIVFYGVVIVFVLYTLALAYHWYAYGTGRATASLSLAVFLLGSAPLFFVMAITL